MYISPINCFNYAPMNFRKTTNVNFTSKLSELDSDIVVVKKYNASPITPEDFEAVKNKIMSGKIFVERYGRFQHPHSTSKYLYEKIDDGVCAPVRIFAAHSSIIKKLADEPEYAYKLLINKNLEGENYFETCGALSPVITEELFSHDKNILKKVLLAKDKCGEFCYFKKNVPVVEMCQNFDLFFNAFSDDKEFGRKFLLGSNAIDNLLDTNASPQNNLQNKIDTISKLFEYFKDDETGTDKIISMYLDRMVSLDNTMYRTTTKSIMESLKDRPEMVYKLLSKKDDDGKNFLFTGSRANALETYIDIFKDEPDLLAKLLLEKDNNGITAFEASIKRVSHSKSAYDALLENEKLSSEYKHQMRAISRRTHVNAKAPVDNILFDKTDEDIKQDFLSTNNFAKEPKIFYYIAGSKLCTLENDLKGRDELFAELLKTRFSNGKNALHICGSNNFKIVRKIMSKYPDDFAKMFLEKDVDGNLPFDGKTDTIKDNMLYAVKSLINDSKYSDELLNTYQEYLSV